VKLVRSPDLHPALIFVAPALDVVLSLVFFVILSTSFLLQPGVGVSVPESPFLLAPQREPQVIGVTAAPFSAIYFENEKVSPAELRALLEAQRGRKRTVVIKADRQAPFDQIAAVMTISLEMGFPTVMATTEEKE